MKKIYYLLISFYSILILGIIIHYIFGLFNFDWQLILNNVERLESFSFFVIVLTFSLTMLMVLGIKVIQMVTLSTIQINLKNILEGRELQETHQSEIDASFQQVSEKLTHLTENLQKSENRALQNEETVIEKEKQENMEESILKLTELMNNADKNNYEDLAIKRTNYFVKNFVLKDTKKKNRNKHNVFEEGVDEIKNIVKELEENEFDELYS